MTDEIRVAITSDLPAIAQIISTQNQNPETHCIQSSATNDANVIQSEMQDLIDQDELRFVVAELGGQVIGCLGCEFERAIGRGWMRGPFLTEPAWERIPAAMLHELRAILPAQIRRLDSFLNQQNQRGHKFYLENGFEQMTLAHVYVAEQEQQQSIQAATCTALTQAQANSFAALHNFAFPETFIDGVNIIRNINQDHHVFVHAHGEVVNGYVYVSIDKHAGEGYIEFLAVQPARRGRGIGLQLLNSALAWCFAEKGVSQVALTVDQKLTNARALYERAGFKLRYTGVNHRLED
jgi:ribosomal protein S18 acetylase RimI-like enzyme